MVMEIFKQAFSLPVSFNEAALQVVVTFRSWSVFCLPSSLFRLAHLCYTCTIQLVLCCTSARLLAPVCCYALRLWGHRGCWCLAWWSSGDHGSGLPTWSAIYCTVYFVAAGVAGFRFVGDHITPFMLNYAQSLIQVCFAPPRWSSRAVAFSDPSHLLNCRRRLRT